MATSINGAIIVNPSIGGVIAVELKITGAINPSVVFGGAGVIPVYYYDPGADITLPLFAINGEGWDTEKGEADIALPMLLLTAEGTVSAVGIADIILHPFLIDIEGIISEVGQGNISLPRISVKAKGILNATGSLNASLPSPAIAALGTIGDVGTADIILLPLSIKATGLLNITGVADIYLPLLRISGNVRSASYLSMVMNIRNKALTQYDNYLFNSMCQFNGKPFGATSTGIYDLAEGIFDDGAILDWNFKTGYLDLHQKSKKKLKQIWFSYKSSGDLMLVVSQADGDSYEYELSGMSVTEEGLRVKIGKGIKKKYIALDMKSIDGSSITLDAMALNFEMIEKIR